MQSALPSTKACALALGLCIAACATVAVLRRQSVGRRYARVYTRACTHVYTHGYTCIRTRVYVQMPVRISTRMPIHMSKCMDIQVCVCVRAYTHDCANVYAHVHTHLSVVGSVVCRRWAGRGGGGLERLAI